MNQRLGLHCVPLTRRHSTRGDHIKKYWYGNMQALPISLANNQVYHWASLPPSPLTCHTGTWLYLKLNFENDRKRRNRKTYWNRSNYTYNNKLGKKGSGLNGLKEENEGRVDIANERLWHRTNARRQGRKRTWGMLLKIMNWVPFNIFFPEEISKLFLIIFIFQKLF